MNIRFYNNPETGQPHIYDHGVDEEEANDVLRNPLEDRPAKNGARSAAGQTRAGRYLRVIYRRDPEAEAILIITAYDLEGKALRALKRFKRRKKP